MKSKNLNDKLIRVERTINIYSNSDNSLIEEIDVNEISVEDLKKIVTPKEDDPLLYDGYMLDTKQVEEFNKVLQSNIVPKFDCFFYVLESEGIYDWEKK